MLRPEVVSYLQENLPKFPVEELRRQLYAEGVSDIDFQDCLAAALRAPRTETRRRSGASSKAAAVFLALGVSAIVGLGLFALSRRSSEGAAGGETAQGESGFVGHHGWVVRLPPDYAGTGSFRDQAKQHEVVHFAPRGTDPTSFLNEGLFGQMGIVRVERFPSPFPDNPTGVSNMARAVGARMTAQGEKYSIKNIQVATLPGLQVNVLAPFPRVEAYVLGKNVVYWFYGGQEDAVWRDIVLSLRDARSES